MNLNFKSKMARTVRTVLAILVCVCSMQTVKAQDNDATTFSVCALNVDGLPNKILGININPDGKGAEGATAIGSYLRGKGIDVMALSEDFNYHAELATALGDGYSIGTYRGGLNPTDISANIKFDTDGLEFITRNPFTFSGEKWTPWTQSYGKFTNGSDDLITKGYRFYTVDMGNGCFVDFYIMHMDADTDPEDNAARASQWEQLRDAVLANNNGRPIIVMGDTNSRYTRDDILGLFINPVEESGHFTVGDAWINLCQDGVYPELDNSERLVLPGSEAKNSDAYRKYEIVDKVLYLNPVGMDGAVQIVPKTILFDAEGYIGEDGELMGDHVPVIVEFEATQTSMPEPPSLMPCAADDWWRGETVVGNGQEVYIYNVGKHYFVSHDSNPTLTDVENAPTWFVRTLDEGYTFDSDIYRLHMEYSGLSWNTSIRENSGATTFTVMPSTEGYDETYPNVYKLAYTRTRLFGGSETRYFNIDTDGSTPAYTAAQTQGPANDWIFISPKQKAAYGTYASLFEKARTYLTRNILSDELNAEAINVLTECSMSNWLNSESDIQALQELIDKIEAVLADVEAPALSDATVKDVYTIDGSHATGLHRGLNIVRMSDGTVKKVMCK